MRSFFLTHYSLPKREKLLDAISKHVFLDMQLKNDYVSNIQHATQLHFNIQTWTFFRKSGVDKLRDAKSTTCRSSGLFTFSGNFASRGSVVLVS